MAPNPNPRRRSRLVASIHDVWPGNFAQVDRELQWLRAHGIATPALFVVPYYHGERNLAEASAFLEWLRAQTERGSLLFAHGYRHWRAERCGERVRRSLRGKWRNSRVQDEGEFAGLGVDAAASLLRLTFDSFARAGFQPQGFAFPAWMGNIPAGMVWPASCRYLDARFRITDLQFKRKCWAPPLTFGREAGSQLLFTYGGDLWLRYLQGRKWIRVALHPGDLEFQEARTAVEKCLLWSDPSTYDRVFASSN